MLAKTTTLRYPLHAKHLGSHWDGSQEVEIISEPCTIYHSNSRKCACKGSGLVTPPAERVGREPQCYCPKHICKRYWPQAQEDGSVKFFELDPKGLTNKEMP